MIGDERKSLDFNMDELEDFVPRPQKQRQQTAKEIERSVDKVSTFPSREAPKEGQLNMRGNQEILDRFKVICKADRRSYVEMLEILMNNFQESSK